MQRTITGIKFNADENSYMCERIHDIIPLTNSFFSRWSNHHAIQQIRENSIYCYCSVAPYINLKIVSNFDMVIKLPDYVDTRHTFFDNALLVVTSEDSGEPCIEIKLNGKSIGWYLLEKNTILATDWTHNYECIDIFRLIWPKLFKGLPIVKSIESLDETTLKSDVTIGADPEFELINKNGHVINACNDNLSIAIYRSIGRDGSGDQVELRPLPGKIPYKVSNNIRGLLKEFSIRYPGYNLGTMGDKFPLGGHIHIGVGVPYSPPTGLVVLLDDFIGKMTLELSGKARSCYKRLGAIRTQPHGFEYRTPPSKIFNDAIITTIVLKLAKNLADGFLNGETFEYDSENITISDLIRLGGLTENQAKYYKSIYKKLCTNNLMLQNWRILRNPNGISFKHTWNPDIIDVILREVAIPGKELPINIVLYGPNARLGRNKCTIDGITHTQYVEPSFDHPTWEHQTLSIGLSWDIRTVYQKDMILQLCEVIKNYINEKTRSRNNKH